MGKSGKHGEHHRAWLKARWCTPGSSLFPPALPELDRLIPPPLPGPMAVGGLGRESEEWAARVAPAGRDADPSPTGTQGCHKLKEQGHCLRYVPGRLQGQPRFTGLGDVRVNFLTGGGNPCGRWSEKYPTEPQPESDGTEGRRAEGRTQHTSCRPCISPPAQVMRVQLVVNQSSHV